MACGASLTHTKTFAVRSAWFLIMVLSAGDAVAGALTLPEALNIAETANPTLRGARAQLEAARGRLIDAQSLLWNNPELNAGRTRRERHEHETGLDRSSAREWAAGLSQTFEVAGQRGLRREAAEAALAATTAEVEEIRIQVRAEVAQQFVRVLSLQQRIAIESETLALFENAANVVDKRRRAGEDSRLDANLAAVEAERARNQLAQAREQLTEARAELSARLQLPLAALDEVVGSLDTASLPYTFESLRAIATTRPRLRALEARERSASRRLRFERASVYPDVTLGISTAREGPADGREKLTTFSVSLPLPLFRRNAEGIGQATTDLLQTQIERQATTRDVQTQLATQWQRLTSLQARVRRLEDSLLPALDQNQQLSSKAYRAGETGLLQILLVNRQVLDARRDALEARTELALTRIAIEQIAGYVAEAQRSPEPHRETDRGEVRRPR